MPFKDTRLGPGTLALGTTPGEEYGFQVSALTLTPSTDSTDGTPTLAEPDPPPELKTSYTLDGSAINDFTTAAGLQRYAYEHDGEEVDFVWIPNVDDGTTLTGRVVLGAFPMGGNVAEQLVTDFSWPCVGKPVFGGDAANGAAADEETAHGGATVTSPRSRKAAPA
jgi:hypothetical protein